MTRRKAQNNIRQIIAAVILGLSVLLCGTYFFWLSPRYTVPILTYHHFGYAKQSLYVTPENFNKQLRYIKNNGYEVISLGEFVDGMKKQKHFKHNAVVITIDDGYLDNYTYAYPVLKKYGFPATIFLVSGCIGADRDFMNWSQAREMRRDNISFGGHTKKHVYLPSIKNKYILKDEIAGCKEVIEKNTGSPADYYCYPTGGFTEAVKTAVKAAGYKGACTTNRGFDTLNRIDAYEIKRIKITNADTNVPFSFRAKLSGYYNLFRKTKQGD